ncbi:MAG: tyrosine-type recombinase/integrase [Lachnospiraceae bacterium]|nr:tyrosine-type recombinase/integrase [Lachnospiraceae bacterium]
MKVDPIRNPKDIKKIKKLLESTNRLRDLAWFTVGLNSGLRTQDLLGLRVGQVDGVAVGERVTITEKKTGKLNVLIVNKPIRAVLDKYLATRPDRTPDEFLFLSRKYVNEPLSVSTVHHYMRAICAQIGLKGNFGSYTLRKTWCYQMRVQYGVPWEKLSARMAHSSPSVTRRYLGIASEEVESVLMNEV